MHAPGGQDPGLAPVLAKEINIKKFHSDIVCKDIKLKNNSSTGEWIDTLLYIQIKCDILKKMLHLHISIYDS